MKPAILPSWIQPEWPAIDGVHAIFTTREGGVSQPPFDSMNLGDHVGDDAAHVAANRQRLAQLLSCGLVDAPGQVRPVFLKQVHGCDVQPLDAQSSHGQAFDACVTTQSGLACTIMVADCLPVLIAHRSGKVVGAAHAGWRGVLGHDGYGVLEALWQAYAQQLRGLGLDSDMAAQTQVWLGPCIGPAAFEVGPEVHAAFTSADSRAQRAFAACVDRPRKWLADLPALARQRWQRMGVAGIYGNDSSPAWCTYQQAELFFSHRRDAAVLGSTGRMAACIWRTQGIA